MSKYLQFHCPIVPIFESRAEGAVGHFVDWPTVYALRKTVKRQRGWPVRYYNIATYLMVFYEQARADRDVEPSVKELDLSAAAPEVIGT